MEVINLCGSQDARASRLDEEWLSIDGKKAHEAPGLRDARSALSRVIEAEIIPRLALAHQVPQQEPVAPASSGQVIEPSQAIVPLGVDVTAFVGLLRGASYPTVMAHIDSLRGHGISAETILLDLFAPAARHLGELWKADLCDFVEVTMALSVLQQLVREHSAGVGMDTVNWTDHRRVLLAPAPGDQHTFGVAIVEKFFRSAGWDVWGGAAGLAFDLPALVRREWFGVVGFSLGCEKNLDALVQLIRQVRRASRNARLGVIVGGPAFLERPDLAVLIGADATAVDANTAVPVAQGLLELGAAAF